MHILAGAPQRAAAAAHRLQPLHLQILHLHLHLQILHLHCFQSQMTFSILNAYKKFKKM